MKRHSELVDFFLEKDRSTMKCKICHITVLLDKIKNKMNDIYNYDINKKIIEKRENELEKLDNRLKHCKKEKENKESKQLNNRLKHCQEGKENKIYIGKQQNELKGLVNKLEQCQKEMENRTCFKFKMLEIYRLCKKLDKKRKFAKTSKFNNHYYHNCRELHMTYLYGKLIGLFGSHKTIVMHDSLEIYLFLDFFIITSSFFKQNKKKHQMIKIIKVKNKIVHFCFELLKSFKQNFDSASFENNVLTLLLNHKKYEIGLNKFPVLDIYFF